MSVASHKILRLGKDCTGEHEHLLTGAHHFGGIDVRMAIPRYNSIPLFCIKSFSSLCCYLAEHRC
jgi:hypothetical protein